MNLTERLNRTRELAGLSPLSEAKVIKLAEASTAGIKYFVTNIGPDDNHPKETIEQAVAKWCKKYSIEAKYLRTPNHSGGWPEYLFWGPEANITKFAMMTSDGNVDVKELVCDTEKEAVSG